MPPNAAAESAARVPLVRRATAADAEALARLRYAFRAAIAPPAEPESAFVARCAAWMAGRLAPDRGWWAWAAHDEHMLIGAVWLHRLEKLPNPVREPEAHGYVTSFYVRESARGAGVGTRLLAAALAECDAQGFDAVILWPTPRSRALYERYGFTVRDDLFERR